MLHVGAHCWDMKCMCSAAESHDACWCVAVVDVSKIGGGRVKLRVLECHDY